MILTHKQKEQFKDALKAAFYNYNLLEQMLYFKLGKNLDEFASSKALDTCVPELIRKADAENWLDELLRGAREQISGNVPLKKFEESLSSFNKLLVKGDINNFEAKIKEHQQFFDIDKWLNKLINIEKQVCKIEINNRIVGTGFLIAHDIVMTNYHVVKDVLIEKNPNISVRFDYKIQNDNVVNQGITYKLGDNWLIDHSQYSSADLQNDGSLPKEDELDYALLRITTKLTDRGFIEIPQANSNFNDNYLPERPLFIIQHPEGNPMKIAFDLSIGLNENQTRLKYKTYTEGGSSGSPCFNGNLDLIALHHCGIEFKYNGGVPINVIKNLLTDRNIKFE